MNYRQYSVEDFMLDPRFRKWVFQPDKEVNLFWEEWAIQHPDKLNLLQEARILLLHLPHEKHTLESGEINALWSNIDQHTDEFSSPSVSDRQIIPLHAEATLKRYSSTGSKPWDYIKTGRVAASVLLVLAFCLSYVLAERGTPQIITKKEMVKKSNPWGQRSTIYLSDGTEVHLNAGSSIAYEKDFNDRERRVSLHGEAFFSVSEDKQRPFRVKSAAVITEALGTSFNINAYDTSQVKVALVTGKVSVNTASHPKNKMILHSGEGAFYHSKNELSKYQFDPLQVLSWKEGIIYFRNADEFTVFHALERWYGVSFKKVNSTNKQWDYTGSFEKKSLEHVLLSIAFAMDFDYEIQQKEVLIHYK